MRTSAIFNPIFSGIFSSFAGRVFGSITEPIYANNNIVVLFSETVDPATVTTVGDGSGSFEIYNNTTPGWVAGVVSTADNLTFSFNPASDLTATDSYTVFLSSAITGLATGRAYNNQNFTFTAVANLTGNLFELQFSGNADDSSGLGNDFTVVNATLTDDSEGNPNSAYLFDGSGDKLTGMGTQSFPANGSIAFKFTPNWDDTDDVFCNNTGSGGNLKAFRLEESGGGGLTKLTMADDSGNFKQLSLNQVFLDGVTYEVVLTWAGDAGRLTAYVNKSLDNTAIGFTGRYPSAFANFSIGGGVVTPARDYVGVIDWMQMWDYELDSDDVGAI